MATFTKLPLSASVDGQQILIAATTSASADQIHTAPAGISSLDEVWIYAYNEATASVVASILWGSTVEPNAVTRFNIPSRSGRTLLVDGKIIQNSLTISAYAGITNVIIFDGFVNRAAF